MTDELVPTNCDGLVADLRTLIEASRVRVAQTVNSELVMLYWRVGHRLRTEVVGEDRAAYGEQLVHTVSKALSAEFGRGFGKRSLYRMIRFAEVFPDTEIVTALRSQLTWTHIRELIAIDDPLERQFYTELGQGFSFIARQKRMSIGADDYYLDLLFFHRPLRALVAIELKLGRFDARDKGQMELYLRWLDRYERQANENPPLGIILCADKNEEQIELLELTDGSVRVASYLTELPPRELLERKLLESIEHARARSAGLGAEESDD